MHSIEWIFSGIGVAIMGWLLTYFFERRKKKKAEQDKIEATEKTSQALNLAIADQEEKDKPNFQYNNICQCSTITGELKLEIINLGNFAKITGVELSDEPLWKLTSPQPPFCIAKNTSTVLEFQLPTDSAILHPESANYSIYLHFEDRRHTRYYSQITVTPTGIQITPAAKEF